LYIKKNMELQEKVKITGFTHFDDIYTNVSWAEIARRYFGKSRENRVRGFTTN